MENTQSSKAIVKQKSQSGTFEAPAFLKYPKALEFNSSLIENKYCYVIKDYGDKGFAVLIKRNIANDNIFVMCGDWNGNAYEIDDLQLPLTKKFLANELSTYVTMMKMVGFDQAQFFFSIVGDQFMLVDMQISLNKFASPGFIRDVFGQRCLTQEVRKIEVIDKETIAAIEKGAGSYEGDLIFKPSRFQLYHLPDNAGVVPFCLRYKR